MRRKGISRKLTGSDIINGYCDRTLLKRGANKVYPNYYLGEWECDLFEVTKAGYTYEFEVKVSRHDFNIDADKQFNGRRKYVVLAAGERVNYFSFIVPEGLIGPEEVPDFAGLIYARGYVETFYDEYGDKDERPGILFSTVKDPILLKKDKITKEELDEISHKLYYRYHQLRNKLNNRKFLTPFTRK